MNGLGSHYPIPHTEISQIVLRRALSEDVMDILCWRNDPHVCAVSRQQDPIDESVHRIWFSKTLEDPVRLLLIGLVSGQKIGVVRFDLLKESLWEVSIALSPESRGRGLGKLLLEMALERLHADHSPTEVLAVARLSNEPSVRLFVSLGFKRESDDGELVRLVLPYVSVDNVFEEKIG